MKKRHVYILFLLLLQNVTLLAQKYSYVHYDKTFGAPFQKVFTSIQDADGYLWVGSENGLYRFDGVGFEHFSIHAKSQHIHQLLGQDGKIIFVNDTGIHQVENLETAPQVSTILEGTINETVGLPFYPNNFLVGKNGEIWISQSNHSIGKYENGTYETFSFSKTNKSITIQLQMDSEGGIFALSPLDGLLQFDFSNNTFPKILDVKKANTFLLDGENVLIGGKELSVFSLKNNQKPRLRKTIPIPDDEVTAIQLDKGGRYIIGTKEGEMFLLSERNNSLQKIYGATDPHRVEELEFGTVHQIYSTPDRISPNGNLWVSTETGLWLLKEYFFETVTDLPKNNPNGIAISSNNEAWVPMNFLYEIKSKNGDFKATEFLENIQAIAVAFDATDHLWVSTNAPDVELLKFRNNQLTNRYPFSDRGGAIFYLYGDSEKNMWFCQAPSDKPIIGIGKIDAAGTIQYYDETKGFNSRILVIKESGRGEIYAAGIGEENYLYRYDSATDAFQNISPELPFSSVENFEVHDMAIDNRGVVWLATTVGLLNFDGEKVNFIQDKNLGKEEMRGVTHLPNGEIWVATATKGLVHFSQNNSTPVGESAGLPAVINSYRCITSDANGRIWAGTAEGLVYSRTSNATLPPSNIPRIKNVKVDHERLPILDWLIREKGDSTFENTAKLSIKDYCRLDIQLVNLSFPSEDIQYQSRMYLKKEKEIMEIEKVWKNLNNNAVANTFTVDKPAVGKYFLEIRARQTGGYQWSPPLEIELDVESPWYKKPYLLYPGLLGLLLVFGSSIRFFVLKRVKELQKILGFLTKRLEEREAQLEQKIQELDVQQEEYQSALSNIHTLELFINAIPKKAKWVDIIAAMGKVVNQISEIDAFEIAFLQKGEIIHRGYSNKEEGGYTFRAKTFNAKYGLTSWAIANHKEILINDFKKEHTLYIHEKEGYHFQSLIFEPFELKNKQSAALCVYSSQINQFDEQDLIMVRILVKFIIFSARLEIKKPV